MKSSPLSTKRMLLKKRSSLRRPGIRAVGSGDEMLCLAGRDAAAKDLKCALVLPGIHDPTEIRAPPRPFADDARGIAPVRKKRCSSLTKHRAMTAF